jgi:ribosomal protein S18 acetylase RimI-like enzyme
MVRRAQSGDVDGIARMWQALVAHHRALDADLPEATPMGALRYARRIADQLENPHAAVYVAQRGDHMLGYSVGLIVDMAPDMFVQERSGFLADIYVEPNARGQGIGRALVQHMTAFFQANGVQYVEWHAAARNVAARQFWQRLGGREVLVRMRLDLPAKKG